MADFAVVLRNNLAKLGETTPEMRKKLYDKARASIKAKIDALPTAPPQAVIDKQYAKLDAAIAEVEADYAAPAEVKAGSEKPDPLKEFLESHSEQLADSTLVAAPKVEATIPAEPRLDEPLGAQTSKHSSLDETLQRSDSAGFDAAAGVDEGAGRPWGAIAFAIVLLGALGVGGYFAYQYKEDVMALFADDVTVTEDGVPVRSVPSTVVPADNGNDAPTSEQTSDVAQATETGDVDKFTQRLTENGVEVDEGPANGSTSAGEGSSVSSQSPGETTAESGGESDVAVSTEPSSIPVGQRAIFYEERTGDAAGTAVAGATVWSVVQESPGSGMEPEPAIRAEASIPDLGLVMEMIIKRNGDKTLPASHLIELFFRLPSTFEGRGISDIQRITLKASESDPGNALIAVPAPLDTNIFMIALTDADKAVETNIGLLRNQAWIDIPMQYVSGRRALITMEKGTPGEAVFQEVLAAWDAAPLQ